MCPWHFYEFSALCDHYQYPHTRLDGSTTTTQRQQVVSKFNSKHSQDFVLLLSSKAGGTGSMFKIFIDKGQDSLFECFKWGLSFKFVLLEKYVKGQNFLS